jgi:hypothetical protein
VAALRSQLADTAGAFEAFVSRLQSALNTVVGVQAPAAAPAAA